MEIIKYISVYLVSMLKFIPGIATGTAMGLDPWENIILSVTGMMSIVVFISMGGRPFRRWMLGMFKKRQTRFRKKRRLLRIWKKYGEWGVAFLSPILLTPILGSLLISSFSRSRIKVYSYMLVSALFWALVLSFSFELAYLRIF